MKLHAKWSTLSVLAMMAFGSGAAVYTGCTVTTGTVDDIDGGSGTPTKDGGTSTSDSGTAGDGGVVGTACQPLNQKQQLIDEACQSCLEQKCCTQLQGCYNAPAGSNGEVDCDTYAQCVDQGGCETDPAKPSSDSDAGALVCDGCRSATTPAVVSGFNEIAKCAATSCATECKVQ